MLVQIGYRRTVYSIKSLRLKAVVYRVMFGSIDFFTGDDPSLKKNTVTLSVETDMTPTRPIELIRITAYVEKYGDSHG